MARSIQASVGLGGSNRADDVHTVQSLLNGVPAGSGGPAAPLDTDGKCGPLTTGAILHFQRAQFQWADGRVDVGGQTLDRLNSLDSGSGSASPPPPSGGVEPPQIVTPPGHVSPPPPPPSTVAIPAGLSPLRRRVLEIALAEALPQPAVSDLITKREDNLIVRAGWRRLKQYFDEGVDGWNEAKWQDKATLDGVRIPGRRIPQKNKESGISWCGIFATWVARQAGAQTKWRSGVGPTGLKLNYSRNCRPGDICVVDTQIFHHFILVDAQGDNLVSVNGNSTNQAILVKPQSLKSVLYYYSVES